MGIMTTQGHNCQDCYKCIRFCPLKAISFRADQAQVIDDLCVFCGLCSDVCPQGAREVRGDFEVFTQWQRQDTPIVVLLDPTYLGLRDDPFRFCAALRQMGVQRVEETAWAIPEVSARYWSDSDKEPALLGSCPSVVRLIERYYPKLVAHLIDGVSPMVAHARSARIRFPGSRIVYIGPCASKKWEAERYPNDIDLVLTFQEVYKGMRQQGISVKDLLPIKPHATGSSTSRQFPLDTGWEKSWRGSDIQGQTWAITGFRQCIQFLDALQNGQIHGQWAHLMLCPGGCLAGPGWNDYDKRHSRQSKLLERLGSHRTDDRPAWEKVDLSAVFYPETAPSRKIDEEEIQSLLRRSGKGALKDQLDCGACGYDSCRGLAVAVVQGQALMDMCIPSSRAQAESMANVIINATPNAIIVVDPKLRVLTINPAAERMFAWTRSEVINQHLRTWMDEEDFAKVVAQDRMIVSIKDFPEWDISTRQIIFPVQGQDVYIGIFIDITKEQQNERELRHLKEETLDKAGEVIEKQMRVAQEIAGLLGETTAETKVLLSQLMQLMTTETPPE